MMRAAAAGAHRLLPVVASARRRCTYGAAHALRDGDWIFTAYRETGAALYRGYPLRTFMCQLFGNAEDPVKGRQMPVHHSVRNAELRLDQLAGRVADPARGRHGLGRQAAEEGRRRGRLLRRGRDVDADLPRQRELRRGVQDPGHPDLPQQRLGDLGAALGADGVADVRAEGDRLRDAGRAGRRQRRPGDDPRRRARRRRAARRGEGADADRGAHLPARRAQHVGRSVRATAIPPSPRSGRAAIRSTACARTCRRGASCPPASRRSVAAGDQPGDPRRARRRRARRAQAAARQPVRGRLRRRPLAPARAAGGARGRAAQARRQETAHGD